MLWKYILNRVYKTALIFKKTEILAMSYSFIDLCRLCVQAILLTDSNKHLNCSVNFAIFFFLPS